MYIHYESTSHKIYELDKLQLLADLYQVDIECLLDDYMLFLYRVQAETVGIFLSISKKSISSHFKSLLLIERIEYIIFSNGNFLFLQKSF